MLSNCGGVALLRVLLVEDEPLTRLELQQIVVAAGYSVVGQAATGEDAIRIAGEQRPDVVLMDISLSGDMDGTDAARKIRETLSIRSLFVSAHMPHLRDSADAARPFGYLLKPVTAEQLVHALEEIARQLGKGS
jgi:DNA-binding NarL/FixJ family response regulator